jgi:hypothetical protein
VIWNSKAVEERKREIRREVKNWKSNNDGGSEEDGKEKKKKKKRR